jgi:Uma2 family endonuclease
MGVATTESAPETAWRKHRWTTAEYDAMLAPGLLREGSKTFLWDGEVIDPSPETEPHANAQDLLCETLMRRLPELDWTISPAHPLSLKDGYKPQPDLAILIGMRSNYRRRVPTGNDAALVVEVAHDSYAEDSGDKLPEYAAAGIPLYWIVHIPARRIEAYSNLVVSSGVGRYVERKDYPMGEAVPLILTRGGETHEFGSIAVLDVLRDSLEEL